MPLPLSNTAAFKLVPSFSLPLCMKALDVGKRQAHVYFDTASSSLRKVSGLSPKTVFCAEVVIFFIYGSYGWPCIYFDLRLAQNDFPYLNVTIGILGMQQVHPPGKTRDINGVAVLKNVLLKNYFTGHIQQPQQPDVHTVYMDRADCRVR